MTEEKGTSTNSRRPVRPRDEMQERKKPCGLDGYCPIVDERRPFAEAFEIFLYMGIERDEIARLAGLAGSKWCKTLVSLQLVPDLPACRGVMEIAAQAYHDAPDDSKRVPYYIAALKREAAKLEKTETRSIDIHSLVDNLMNYIATNKKGPAF